MSSRDPVPRGRQPHPQTKGLKSFLTPNEQGGQALLPGFRRVSYARNYGSDSCIPSAA